MLFLEKLKKKPPHIKERYALGFALSVTLLIGSLWVVSLPAKLAGDPTTDGETGTERGGGFTSFLDSTKEQFGAVLESLEHATRTEEYTLTTENENDQAPTTTSAAENENDQVPTTTSATAIGTLATSSDSLGSQHTATPTIERKPRTVLIATTSSEKSEQESR